MTLDGSREQIVGDVIAHMRHNGCGGPLEFVELITGIPVVGRPVRRVVLIERTDS